MSEVSQGPGWWQASDGRWYPPAPYAPPPPVGYGGYSVGPVTTDGRATASLVFGILGFVILPLIGPIVALIFGVSAKRRIRREPGVVGGDGMATAGIVLGSIGLAMEGLAVLGLVFITFLGQSASKKFAAIGSTLDATTTVEPVPTTSSSRPPRAAPVLGRAALSGPTPCPSADGSSPPTATFAMAPPTCIEPGRRYEATFDTTEGRIVVALDTTRTPGTVNNFVVLSRYHYYDKSSFDRIDPTIDIIQGGSPTTQSISDPGPGYTINDEGGRFAYSPGDLVMARTQRANSGAAQYFFVVGPKASVLDTQGTYVTFGHVTQGFDTLQKVVRLYQACDMSDQTCLGGAPSRVVLVNSITITTTN